MAKMPRDKATIHNIKEVPNDYQWLWSSYTYDEKSSSHIDTPSDIDAVHAAMVNPTRAGYDAPIWRGVSAGSGDVYAQDVIQTTLGLSEGDVLTGVDIENLGTFLSERDKAVGHRAPTTDIFGITEIGLKNYQVSFQNGQKMLNPFGEGYALATGIDDSTKSKIQSLIHKVKSGGALASVTEDEYRTLWWLTKYSDPNNFGPQNGMKVIKGHVTPPVYGASLATHIKAIESGLNNLTDTRLVNTLAESMEFINNMSKGTKGFLGFNNTFFDMPKLAAFGKNILDTDVTKVANLDMYHLVNVLFPDFQGFLNKHSKTFKPGTSENIMKLEVINDFLDIKTGGTAHLSVNDVESTAALFNFLTDPKNGNYIGHILDNRTVFKDMPGYNPNKAAHLASTVFDSRRLKEGDHLFAIRGLRKQGLGIYDTIFDPSGSEVGKTFNTAIYKDIDYQIKGFYQFQHGDQTMYGVELYNTLDKLTHHIVRNDERELQAAIHNTFMPWKGRKIAAKSYGKQPFELTTSFDIQQARWNDLSRRKYLRMFEVNSPSMHGINLLEKYLNVYNEVSSVPKKEGAEWDAAVKAAVGKHFKYPGMHERDFKQFYNRFSSEAGILQEFTDELNKSNLSPYQKNIALNLFKEEIDKRYPVKSMVKLPATVRQLNISNGADVDITLNLANKGALQGSIASYARQTHGEPLTVGTFQKQMTALLTTLKDNAADYIDESQFGLRPKSKAKKIKEFNKRMDRFLHMVHSPVANDPNNASRYQVLRSISAYLANHLQANPFVEMQDAMVPRIMTEPWADKADVFENIIDRTKLYGADNIGRDINGNMRIGTGNAPLLNLIDAYDTATQDMHTKLGLKGQPTSLRSTLATIAMKFANNEDKTEVDFLVDGKHNGLLMVLYAQGYANEVRHQDFTHAAQIQIPLLDQNGFIGQGRVNKINQFYFSFVGGAPTVETGANRLLRKMGQSYSIKLARQMITEGNTLGAQKLMKRVSNKAMEELSGASSYLDLAEQGAVSDSKALNWLRGGQIHLGEAINDDALRGSIGFRGKPDRYGHYKFDDATLDQKAALIRQLPSWLQKNNFDINVNFQSVMNTAALGGILNTHDIRALIPFGTLSSYQGYASLQAQNYYNLDRTKFTGKLEKMLNPLLMTETGAEVYGQETPWFTARAMEIDDYKLRDKIDSALGKAKQSSDYIYAKTLEEALAKAKEANHPNPELIKTLAKELKKAQASSGYQFVTDLEEANRTASTYEGNAIAHEDVRNILGTTERSTMAIDAKEDLLFDPNTYIGQTLTPNQVLGTRETGQFDEKTGNAITEKVYYKYSQTGKVMNISREGDKILFDIEKSMPAQIGTKVMDSTGEKFTVGSYWKDNVWKAVFGDPNEVGYIGMAPTTAKHKDYASLVDKNIRLALSDVEEIARTVGGATTDAMRQQVLDIFQKTFGISATYSNEPGFGTVLKIPDLIKHGDTQGVTLNSLHSFMEQMGVLLHGNGTHYTEARLGSNGQALGFNVGVHSFLRPHIDENTLDNILTDNLHVRYGQRELGALAQRGDAGRRVVEWIKHNHLASTEELGVRTKALAKANASTLGAGPASGEKIFLSESVDTAKYLSGTSGQPVYDPESGTYLVKETPGGLNKLDDYKGTIFDNEKFGAGWYELPENTVNINGNNVNAVYFLGDDLKTINGQANGDVVLSELQRKQLGVVNASHELRKARSGNLNADEMSSLQGRVQNAVLDYQKEVGRAISGAHGEVTGEFLTTNFNNSGRFRIKEFSPLVKAEEGTWYVSQQMAENMLDGVGSKKYKKQLLKQMTEGEGLISLANRYPTMYKGNVTTARIKIDKTLEDSTAIRMTVGDAALMKGDQDGDWLSLVLAHYKSKDKQAINDLETIHKEGMEERTAKARAVEEEYFGSISKEYGFNTLEELYEASKDDKKLQDLLRQRTEAMDNIVAREGRLGIGYTGTFSNLNTKLTKLAETVSSVEHEGKSVVTVGDALKHISNFGVTIEQKAISSKKMEDVLAGLATEGERTEAIMKFENARGNLLESIYAMGRQDDKKARQTIQESLKILGIESPNINEELDAIHQVAYLAAGDRGLGSLLGSPSMKYGRSEGIAGEQLASFLNMDPNQTFTPLPEHRRLAESLGKTDEFNALEDRFKRSVVGNYLIMSGKGDRQAAHDLYADTLVSSAETVGSATAEGIATSLPRIELGGNASALAWGALGFMGISLIGNIAKSNPVPPESLPQPDQAPLSDGTYLPTTQAGMPSKKAYITNNGGGYENVQLNISANSVSNLSDEEVGQVVLRELDKQMRVRTDVNITTTDNTQKIDRAWIQQTVANALG